MSAIIVCGYLNVRLIILPIRIIKKPFFLIISALYLQAYIPLKSPLFIYFLKINYYLYKLITPYYYNRTLIC